VLVGRQRELGELATVFADADAGRGALVLIRGEPGIGKSRLASAFVESTGSGVRSAWGRAWEVGGAPAYWPWIEAFRSLWQQAPAERDALPRSRLAELAQIDAELAAHVGDIATPPQLEPQQARFRLFDAASAVIAHFAARAPLVIVLDDLHAADAASIEMLQFVARTVRTTRAVIVATYRDSEARSRAEIADAIARLGRDAKTIALQRLAETTVSEWVTQEGRPELAGAVYARSEGNPLFVVELLRLADELGDRGLAEIPDTVRDVIGQRLRTLEGATHEVLQVAAVLGRNVDLRIVGHVLERPVDIVTEQLAPAVAARVIGAGKGTHEVMFSHVLIQEVLYNELPTTQRASLHGAIADALLARSSAQPAFAEIAHHLFAAIPVRGSAAAIETARRAAADASAHLAFDDAVALLERAVSEVPLDDDTRRADILLELARTLFTAARATDGHARALEALAVIRRLGDAERLARAVLLVGSAPRFAMVDPELVALLEETLATLPDDDSPLRARVLGRLGAAKQPAPDFEPPMQLAREAIAMSRRTRADAATHLEVLHSATAAMGFFADPAERIALNQELASVASRLGDKPRTLRGHLRLVFDYIECGDPVQADACIEVCARLAAQLGRPAYQWSIPFVRAMRKVMQGEFAAAEALVEEARAIASQAEDANYEASFTLHRLGFLRTAARNVELAEALPTIAPVIRRLADLHYTASCLAGSYARVGALAEARACVDQLTGRVNELGGRQSTVWVAEAAAALDDAALSAQLIPLLTPIASRNLGNGVWAMWCEGPITRALGLAATTAHEYDQAEQYFETALERVDILGAPPHRARIEVEYAAMLRKRNRAGDRDRAARLTDAARETADRIGLPDLFATAPIAPPCANPAEGFELKPEGDYWTITEGKSVFRMKDSRGLRIVALLVASPDREFHVLDLSATPGEAAAAEDAGEALDARAIAAYKHRVLELRQELAQAEDWEDRGRASRLREELEAVAGELAAGLGLGGRARRQSSNVERARVNVRKRVLDAITRIGEHNTSLAQHLERTIKTGTFCVYRPARG
jgi:tetratricopeptide (TPR) repeat protein